MDAAAGGAFLSLDVAGARTLIDKVVSNQSWKEEKFVVKGVDSR